MSRPDISLRQHLRSGTQDLHDELDASIRARGYLGSRAGFREFLARSLVFQSTTESLLEEASIDRLIPDWHLRRRAHLLRADLHALEFRDDPPVSAGDVAGFFTEPWNDSRLLGAAYVLEGSTLGASLVLRDIAPLGLVDGASYLRAGQSPGRRWQTFAELLATHDTPAFDRTGALSAARCVFSAARVCFG